MVPCAERVKFVSSGTEATLLAMRVARAHSGKNKILRFRGHFHGWHDYAMVGYKSPYDVPASGGIPPAVSGTILQADCNDLDEVARLLDADSDVAAVILEPGGGSNGAVPNKPGFLQGLRELTQRKGVILIFDEVISGFRFAPGGAEELLGVTPDLTTLGKIVAGGLPGGALVGKRQFMEMLEFRDGDYQWERFRRVLHQGTYNANPLSAVAGITLLRLVADGKAQKQAEDATRRIVEGFNESIVRHGLPGCAYYGASVWHLLPNVKCPYRDGCNKVDCQMDAATLLAGVLAWAPAQAQTTLTISSWLPPSMSVATAVVAMRTSMTWSSPTRLKEFSSASTPWISWALIMAVSTTFMVRGFLPWASRWRLR